MWRMQDGGAPMSCPASAAGLLSRADLFLPAARRQPPQWAHDDLHHCIANDLNKAVPRSVPAQRE
jgi:hypothetical protein